VNAESDVKQLGPADWAIVAVKTYSLAEVATAAQYLAQGGALIIPLLNGIDIADRLVELGVPRENVLGGLTTISAVRTSSLRRSLPRQIPGNATHCAANRSRPVSVSSTSR